MSDRDVTTIGDLIYCQHAKIIAKSAFGVPDGREAKGKHCGFVRQRVRGWGGRSLRPSTGAFSVLTQYLFDFLS